MVALALSALRSSLVVHSVPPKGFVWGGTYIFDKAGKTVLAEVVGEVAPAVDIHPVRVTSWYDAGVRLETTSGSIVSDGLDIEELTIGRRIGSGAQGDVRLAELPGTAGPVAVKVGLKPGAVAREAAVLSMLSGVRGIPALLHHEPAGPDTPGGALVLELLGPSLHELHERRQSAVDPSGTPDAFRGTALLRVGSELVRLLRELHLVGVVHNDVKPANVLLSAAADELHASSRLHLVDFGSCTVATDLVTATTASGIGGTAVPPHIDGPIGTASFASVAADERHRPTRPIDDIESLVYTLAFLAAGRLPWHGQPAELVMSTKRELLLMSSSSSAAGAALTDDVGCASVAAALQALYAEVRRCRGGEGGSVDYEACLAALGEPTMNV